MLLISSYIEGLGKTVGVREITECLFTSRNHSIVKRVLKKICLTRVPKAQGDIDFGQVGLEIDNENSD